MPPSVQPSQGLSPPLALLLVALLAALSADWSGTTLERSLETESTQSLIAIWTTGKRGSDDEIR